MFKFLFPSKPDDVSTQMSTDADDVSVQMSTTGDEWTNKTLSQRLNEAGFIPHDEKLSYWNKKPVPLSVKEDMGITKIVVAEWSWGSRDSLWVWNVAGEKSGHNRYTDSWEAVTKYVDE